MRELYIARLKEISWGGIKQTYTLQEERNLKKPNLIHNFSTIDELVEATIYLGREKNITFNFDVPWILFSTRDNTGLGDEYNLRTFNRLSYILEPLNDEDKKEFTKQYSSFLIKIMQKDHNEYLGIESKELKNKSYAGTACDCCN